MKSQKDIKRLVREFRVTAGAKMDQKVREDVLEVMKKSKQTTSAKAIPNIWQIIMNSKITKLAAAAVIILAVSLFLIERNPEKQAEKHIVAQSKSPAELLTVASLNLAYRHGGMKAAEEQSRKALGMVSVAKSNIKQLQEEFIKNNGI